VELHGNFHADGVGVGVGQKGMGLHSST
jgi:hypothetical protein